MIKLIIIVLYLALALTFCKNALHMFQQNRYEIYRYTKWLFSKRNIHFSINLVFILLMILTKIYFRKGILIYLGLVIIFAVINIYKEEHREYIKDLVYTARVKRQVAVFSVLMILLTYILINTESYLFAAIMMVFGPYLLIYVLYVLTEPFERLIKKSYENKARNILNGMDDLVKIGITGSFGKTTTKNVVTDIIGESYYTLMTPASYNTPMGITKTIREFLKPIHEVFVCEMGADHVGEITYLMDFVKPKYGIVTSIGPQHLNTFKSMNNIIYEKMQMIEKLPVDGVGIINYDNEFIRNYPIKNSCKIIKIGIDNEQADINATDIKYSKNGSIFKVKLDGKNYKFETVLLGLHNITNLLSGIALAKELGLDNKTIVQNVKNVNRVEHRLELKEINGFTFIDNAFNSNPVGCKLSLDVLEMMPGKRVIVTPGLIDLGTSENSYNYEFGKYMLNKADFVILIGEKNSAFIKKGLVDSGFDMNNVLVFNTVKEAFGYIYTNLSTKDTILLENDLPDAFLY